MTSDGRIMAPIHLEIRCYGPVRRSWPELVKHLAIPEPLTVQALLESLSFRPEEMSFLLVALNGMKTTPSTLLKDGDVLTISLLLGGG